MSSSDMRMSESGLSLMFELNLSGSFISFCSGLSLKLELNLPGPFISFCFRLSLKLELNLRGSFISFCLLIGDSVRTFFKYMLLLLLLLSGKMFWNNGLVAN